MPLHWKMLLVLVVFCSAMTSLAATPSLAPSKHALVLYPERPDTPAHLQFEQSLRSTFSANTAHRIDFYAEYMDISRFFDEAYVTALHELYRRKYAGRKMDLIIAVTRRPLEFLLQYGQELFPGTPVVFCSIDAETLQGLDLGAHMTGIVRHILYVIFYRDGGGRSFLGSESGALVAQAANVPVYGVFEVLVGTGVVGGHMYSHVAVGAQVGALGSQILNGQPPKRCTPLRRGRMPTCSTGASSGVGGSARFCYHREASSATASCRSGNSIGNISPAVCCSVWSRPCSSARSSWSGGSGDSSITGSLTAYASRC